MSLVRQELDKIFRIRKGWIIVLAAIFWLVAVQIPEQYKHSLRRKEQGAQYFAAVNALSGPWTEEKGSWLKAEVQRTNEADQFTNQLNESFLRGELDQEHYRKLLREALLALEQSSLMDELTQKMKLPEENPQQHWILWDAGWNNLLAGSYPMIPLVIALLILLAPLISGDFESGIHPVIASSRYGRSRLAVARVTAAMITAVALTVLLNATNMLGRSFVETLPLPNAPLQSIIAHMGARLRVSLWQGYLLLVLIRCWGAVLLAILTVFLSGLIKRTFPTLFFAFAAIMLPDIFYVKELDKCLLPGPLGYLIGVPWLRTGGVARPGYTMEYPSVEQMIVTLAVSSAAALIMVLWIALSPGIRLYRIRRRMGSMTSVLLILTLISGCTPGSGAVDSIVLARDLPFNPPLHQSAAGENWFVYETDVKSGVYVLRPDQPYDQLLVRDPLIHLETVIEPTIWKKMIRNCDLLDGEVFFLRDVNDREKGVEIVGQKLGSSNQRILYRETEKNPDRKLLGLRQSSSPNPWMAQSNDIRGLVRLNHGFVLIRNNSMQILRDGEKKPRTVPDSCRTMAYAVYQQGLFYVDFGRRIVRYDLNTGEQTFISDQLASCLWIAGNRIIFQRLDQQDRLYSCSMEGEDVKPFFDQTAPRHLISSDGESLFLNLFQDNPEQGFIRLAPDGSILAQTREIEPSAVFRADNSDYLLVKARNRTVQNSKTELMLLHKHDLTIKHVMEEQPQ